MYTAKKDKIGYLDIIIKFKLKNWPYVSSCTPHVLPIALSHSIMYIASAPNLPTKDC